MKANTNRSVVVASLALALAASVSAAELPESLTKNFFCPYDLRDVYASVIKAEPTATEYLIQCGRPDDLYGLCNGLLYNEAATLTLGPATMAMTQYVNFTESPPVDKTAAAPPTVVTPDVKSITQEIDCRLFGHPRTAVCTWAVYGMGFHGINTLTVFESTEYWDRIARMTITDGLEKLPEATAFDGVIPKATSMSSSSAVSTSRPSDRAMATAAQTTTFQTVTVSPIPATASTTTTTTSETFVVDDGNFMG